MHYSEHVRSTLSSFDSSLVYFFQVLYETKSLVHGIWPAFTCRKGVGEGFPSRLAYTWIGVTWLSIIFYLFAISVYQLVGRRGASQFSGFVLTVSSCR